MTERADQLHNDKAPTHCTALVQAFFFGKVSHHPGVSAPLQPIFGSLRLLAFPTAKIAFERKKTCECDCHTVHKLSQRRLTVDWLAPRESDCSRKHSKVSSDWLPSYIKATPPVLEIFKMAWYLPDSPRTSSVAGVSRTTYLSHLRGSSNPRSLTLAAESYTLSWNVYNWNVYN